MALRVGPVCEGRSRTHFFDVCFATNDVGNPLSPLFLCGYIDNCRSACRIDPSKGRQVNIVTKH